MNILFVTGIFPPDHGGPASYVPRMAAALAARGENVEVICLSDSLDHDDSARPFKVTRLPRRTFWPLRIAKTVFTVWRAARRNALVFVHGATALMAGDAAVPAVEGDIGRLGVVGPQHVVHERVEIRQPALCQRRLDRRRCFAFAEVIVADVRVGDRVVALG